MELSNCKEPENPRDRHLTLSEHSKHTLPEVPTAVSFYLDHQRKQTADTDNSHTEQKTDVDPRQKREIHKEALKDRVQDNTLAVRQKGRKLTDDIWAEVPDQ